MAHQVESMFFAGKLPWHGLGKPVDKELNSADAIVAAGLDWETQVRPLYVTQDDGFTSHEVAGAKAVVRTSDFSTLGVVGERYQPVQNKDAFEFFDAVVGEGKAIYHTAGSLFSGKKVWILAKVPGEIILGKDVTEKYLLLSNTHDGSGTLRMSFTPTRVVCANTLNVALKGIAGQGISIRHTKSVGLRMQNAAKAMVAASEFYEAFNVQAQKMYAFKYSFAQLNELVLKLFPSDAASFDVSKSILAKRDKVKGLFEYGKGHEDIRGTAWAALNAVAEYADHGMRTRMPTNDKRADSIWFGTAANLKQQASDIINSQMAC